MAGAATKLAPNSNAGKGLFDSPGRRRVVVALLLALTTLLAYNPVTNNDFVSYDDPGYITQNRHVQEGLRWETVRWAFVATEQANWHPLTWLSHALDWQIFGARPAGHHYVNVLLHLLCVVLLFLFLEGATGRAGCSGMVAALFAIHPINVQSVAWASERKNVLCTVFFLLALLAYQKYVQHPSVKRYLIVAFCFALGLMAKPMVITLPFVLLLLDYWPLQRMKAVQTLGAEPTSGTDSRAAHFWNLLLEKLPLLALSIASGIITMIAQKAGGAIRGDYSFPVRVQNALVSYALYIEKAIWPAGLAALYPHPGNTLPRWEIIASVIFLGVLTAAVLLLGRRPYLAMGWFWYLGTLVPMIGFVQVGDQAMADRYAYIAFIGLFLALVWGVADWAQHQQIRPAWLVVAGGLVIVTLALATRVQITYWHDSESLWSRALAVTRNNYLAHDNLGVELLEHGRLDDAAAHFQAAAEINPRDAFSQINLGVYAKRRGDLKAALEHYQLALGLSSERTLRSNALSNIGAIYRKQGDYPRAKEHYESALALFPDNQFAIVGLGLVAQKMGDSNQAVEWYSRAVAARPSDVGYLLLAQALSKAGRREAAQIALAKAQQISANWDLAQQAVKGVLAE